MEAAARDLDAGRPIGSGVEWRVGGDRYVMKNSWPTIKAVDAGSSSPVEVERSEEPRSKAKAIWPNLA
jgi:hypothetical protein